MSAMDAFEQALDKIVAIEEDLEKLQDEQAEEEAKIAHQFHLKRAPLLKKRNDILTTIPQFWRTAIENHSDLSDLMEKEDYNVLDHLKSIEIERPADDYKTFKLLFHFDNTINPYFTNEVLWKQLTSSEEDVKIVNSPIDWKEGKCLIQEKQADSKGKRKAVPESFFEFFTDTSSESAQIASVFITDLVPNVIEYFQGEDDELEGASDLEIDLVESGDE